jgi:hypothetical protein
MFLYAHQKFLKIFRRVKIKKAPTSIHTDLLIFSNPATPGGGGRDLQCQNTLGRVYVTHTSGNELA